MRRMFTLAALLLAAARPALAKDERPPSPQERTAIGLALREKGYVRWEGIRRDSQYWEVDSAWDRQGRRFELKVHEQTLRIIEKERED